VVDSREDVSAQMADLAVGVVRCNVEAQLSGAHLSQPLPIDHLVAEASPLTTTVQHQLAAR
jgi:hypothetical protein